MVTILIPTVNRPDFLKKALQSVSAQTARDRIGRVVVSENGGSQESRKVCAAFPELPIHYVFREPAVSAVEHGRMIMIAEAYGQYTAILHDDDWWCPWHLAGALRALDADPGVSSVFSSHFETESPAHQGRISIKSNNVWVASGGDFSADTVILDKEAVMLSILIDASFHYSTCIGRTEALAAAYQGVVDSGNKYDNDRTFPPLLALHGNIAYLTVPDVFIRLHGANDFSRYNSEQEGRLKIETTKWLREKFPAEVAGAVARFNSRLANFTARDLEMISQINPLRREFLIDELKMKMVDYRSPGLGVPRRRGPAEQLLDGARQIVLQTCPPFIASGVRGLKRRFRAARQG